MTEDFEFGDGIPEESSNRTYLYVVVVLGTILVVSIIALALWMLVFSPGQQETPDIEATQTAAALTQIALPPIATSTNTPWPSETTAPTAAPSWTHTLQPPAQDPTATATLIIVSTATPTPTALPSTGFADDIGLPGLVSLGFLLVIVAFAARRIRLGMTN